MDKNIPFIPYKVLKWREPTWSKEEFSRSIADEWLVNNSTLETPVRSECVVEDIARWMILQGTLRENPDRHSDSWKDAFLKEIGEYRLRLIKDEKKAARKEKKRLKDAKKPVTRPV